MVREKIKEHKKEKEVFEIGCYPGKFLAIFGKNDFVLNGIDLFPKINCMKDFFIKENYRVGDFYQKNFLEFNSRHIKYDIVCSFGFIEHFKKWEDVLVKHIEITKEGGSILIDVPNLKSPLYYFFYKIFEPEVLKSHEIRAMNKNKICAVFKKNNCLIKEVNYQGYFYFRFATRHDKFSKIITKIINLMKPILELLPEAIYKRYIVIHAIKK